MYNETIRQREVKRMKQSFGEALLAARKRTGMSQQQLADSIPVNRSSVANWEADRRLPDASMIAKIAEILGVDISDLLEALSENNARPVVIIVDDSKIILTGGMPVLEKALPNATITGFTKPSQALEYARQNRVALAFLDIEIGSASGIDLCNMLLEINPHTNIIFLTAYEEYSINAWKTEASGFLLKPITLESVRAELKKLRHPFPLGSAGV